MPPDGFAIIPNDWIDEYHDPVDLSVLVYLIRTRNYESGEATLSVRALADRYRIGHGRAVRLLSIYEDYRNKTGTKPEQNRNTEGPPAASLQHIPERMRNKTGTKPEQIQESFPPDPLSKKYYQETRNKTTTRARARDFVLPDWIDSETWDAFEEMRRKIKRPLTDRARQLTLGKLSELRAQGHASKAVLEQSILNSWQGVFPLRNEWLSNRNPSPVSKDAQALAGYIKRDRTYRGRDEQGSSTVVQDRDQSGSGSPPRLEAPKSAERGSNPRNGDDRG